MLMLFHIPVYEALFFVLDDGEELVVLLVDNGFEADFGFVLGWRRRNQLRKHTQPSIVVLGLQDFPLLDSALVFLHVNHWVLGWRRRVVRVLDVLVNEAYLHIFLIIISFDLWLSIFPLPECVILVAGRYWKDALPQEDLVGGCYSFVLHEFTLLATGLGLGAPLHDGLVFRRIGHQAFGLHILLYERVALLFILQSGRRGRRQPSYFVPRQRVIRDSKVVLHILLAVALQLPDQRFPVEPVEGLGAFNHAGSRHLSRLIIVFFDPVSEVINISALSQLQFVALEVVQLFTRRDSVRERSIQSVINRSKHSALHSHFLLVIQRVDPLLVHGHLDEIVLIQVLAVSVVAVARGQRLRMQDEAIHY